MATDSGVCHAITEVTAGGTERRRRAAGITKPARAAPKATRRTSRAERKRLDRHRRRPRLLDGGDRAGHQVLGGWAVQPQYAHAPLELAIGVAIDERRVVA